ncbi:hypothetical protein HCU64_01300 [Methylobacterium sp. C25]|uniref:hypothetical protein n=1 Tax=Methylobacterium sp. C25 TaxID=2721622 RepID=UPI001F3FAB17|nr:hypothetical protein [Methylobacterium sp. C25]MCE4222374.1 hypothetical protein [Methylobacterium sp. C25]
MTAPLSDELAGALISAPVATIRARAAADARFLRALARTALADGLPRPELRALNARNAARRVLDHARRMSSVIPAAADGVRPAEMAD